MDASYGRLNRLLRGAMAEQNADRLTESLLARFGSYENVLEADPADLMRVPGVTESIAVLLTAIPLLARELHRERMGKKPIIRNCAAAKEYLRLRYIGMCYEEMTVLFLREDGALLSCKTLQCGTVDEAPLYIRNIAEEALRENAAFLVLSHNHPGTSTAPSRADIESTKALFAVMEEMGIPLLDHILIADTLPVSLRENGYLRDLSFSRQGFAANWL